MTSVKKQAYFKQELGFLHKKAHVIYQEPVITNS